MEFESENPAPEPSGGNDLALPSNCLIGDDVKVERNGSCTHVDEHDLSTNGNGHCEPSIDIEMPKKEDEKLNLDFHADVELSPGHGSLHSNRTTSDDYVDAVTVVSSSGKVAENDQSLVSSPVSPVEAPLGSPVTSPPSSGSRGKGLRKWRRIRREHVSDGSPVTDSAKVLKRGSEDVLNPSEPAVENKQRSENVESFINVMLQNPIDADAFPAVGSGIDYELTSGSTFDPGTISDEESKLCVAANIPKSRHDLPRASGHSRDKHRTKHTSGKHSGNTFQRLQQETDQIDDGMKARVEAFSMDKENSLSSLESEPINFNAVFMQGFSSVVSNGQSDTHVVEQSDDGPAFEKLVEGLSVDSIKRIEDEDVLRGDSTLSRKTKERDENHQPPGNWDPLADCVEVLQSAQDALEQEILKFSELGKDLRPLDDYSIRTRDLGAEVSGSSSSEWPTFEDSARDTGENPEILEKQLAQAKAMLEERESRITELEATINSLKTSNGDLGLTINIQQKKLKEIEAEFDTLYKQKMETEIQHLAIADTRTIAENQLKDLLVQQKSLVTTQAQGIQKIGHLAGEAVSLRDKTEEAVTSSRGAEAGKMKKRVTKFSFCFFVQLILFVFVAVLFISEFLPKTEIVLPT